MVKIKQISDLLQNHTASVMSMVVHDRKIVSRSFDVIIRVWNIKTIKQISFLQSHTASVMSMVVYDEKIMSRSYDKTIRSNNKTN
jgi:WD40 repeat protein